MSRGPGALQTEILAALADAPMTTRAIVGRVLVDDASDDQRSLVRRALRALVRRGLVTRDEEAPGPDVYELTAKGRAPRRKVGRPARGSGGVDAIIAFWFS